MKKYVIAGNSTEARDWIRENMQRRQAAGETTLSLSEYVTVNTVSSLYGVADVSGVFYGSWKERDDIEEIVQELLHKQSSNRVLLKRILKVWKNHKYGTITPKQNEISVFVNGVLQQTADYGFNNSYITFDEPPPKGTDIQIHYGTEVAHHCCDGYSDSFLISKPIKQKPLGYTGIDIDQVYRDELSDASAKIDKSILVDMLQDTTKSYGWDSMLKTQVDRLFSDNAENYTYADVIKDGKW